MERKAILFLLGGTAGTIFNFFILFTTSFGYVFYILIFASSTFSIIIGLGLWKNTRWAKKFMKFLDKIISF